MNTYYPFGLLHNYPGPTQNAYQYKYNGKGLQETGMYSLDWRQYMPDIGRFGVIDPLAGVIPSWTPYRYAFDNPIYFRDPNGLIEQGPNYVSDWIRNSLTGSYKFDPNVKGPADTPNGFEYVGPSGSYINNNGEVVNLLSNGEKETLIQEINVAGKKSESGTLDYLNFLNDRMGDSGDLIKHRPNQGGSIGFWTSSINNRRFDNITYNRLNVRYYSSNWTGGGRARVRTINVSKFLKKGSIVGQVILGAVEIGQSVADDIDDYNTKGETNGKNTAVAAGSVAGGVAGGWAGAEAGAAVGAAVGVWFGGVGAVPGAVIGGIIGGALGSWGGSEIGKAGVEKAYE